MLDINDAINVGRDVQDSQRLLRTMYNRSFKSRVRAMYVVSIVFLLYPTGLLVERTDARQKIVCDCGRHRSTLM